MKKELRPDQSATLLETLQTRFEKNRNRHQGIDWVKVRSKLESQPQKLWSLYEMENSEGEPDLIGYDQKSGEYLFVDCSAESPKGRRSCCYDRAALDARKEHKPKTTAMDLANAMGIDILTEEQYRALQQLGNFDSKTSSWVKTPAEIRERGGAVFCDYRYGQVFLYHNGADSYYAARGFRGMLRV